VQAIILGSAAGGGVPQWNCRCSVCRLAWAGDPRVTPRTQSSLAVSVDGERWLIINASPDIRQQIEATSALQPRAQAMQSPRALDSLPARHSPIVAVLLTNGDVDHVAGLLSLRENQPFTLYATPETLRVVGENRIFDVVAAGMVTRRQIRLDAEWEPLPGLRLRLFAVPGKVPLWLEGDAPMIGEAGESTIGVSLAAGGRRMVSIPGCAEVTPRVRADIGAPDLLLFDGTLWRDDEMVSAGLGSKTGRRMGHIAMSGADGSIAALAGIEARRRVFVHINNTNAALIEGSPERLAAERAGWEIGFDGMRFDL
jgi:pyrroloquinoline quinone biosynthesis protein B